MHGVLGDGNVIVGSTMCEIEGPESGFDDMFRAELARGVGSADDARSTVPLVLRRPPGARRIPLR